ncbi:hypothetical protein [Rubinisphaera margarita]|uniref:hypothetical protein n=1 Tax=Rubinisphaera margarita TaxID=2909586 RepID=UPI001EE99E4B|nr:hypothetical protein [Rubinisphaera margarita]MCG6157320.1 hypothetical protein [Rubinisphaera margarita]
MVNFSSFIRIMALACVLLAGGGTSCLWAESLTNEMCPVMTDRKVDREIFIERGDTKIYFCCEICRAEFGDNPDEYVANLPPALRHVVESDSKSFPSSRNSSSLSRTWHRFQTLPIWSPADYFSGVPYWPVLILVSLIVIVWVLALPIGTTFRRRYLSIGLAAHCTAYLILITASLQFLLIALAYRQISHENAASYSGIGPAIEREGVAPQAARMHQEMHYHFGNPPQPPFPTDDGPALEKRYYRGNDERDPELFNGGNYLTCTFDVAVVDDAGTVLTPGAARPEKCSLKLTITRAPFTADVLYSDRIMEHVFATKQYELPGLLAASDRVNLKSVKKDQVWELRYPLEADVPSGEIYLWHLNLWGADSVPLLHYAIHYNLETVDGVIGEAANVQFGALRLTTPVIRYQMPIEEWLRTTPFPELQSPGPADPKKLGIDEHVKHVE